ncbi:DUF1326 domain-containing protein [Pelagibius litoralis]|uniref:DUF1326 domain-containing protein n=1 Tax=Pelagibius litoralis TaxID=374515 RepID=A0A967K9B2_9PROT|nr:DUF1326 domain-containing protein [Pelagibius litoralis]NIA70933.1 DUF1326 domain-containing protein [Pelagibius litoralis]
MASVNEYHIQGSYFEACNCEAICPCRRQNGVANGLSTYGICDFLLSWQIDRGSADGVDLSGIAVSMAGRYSDEEEGTPWSVIIYIDENAGDDQFEALSEIFQGNAKGNILFTGNISKVLAVKRARIALDHAAGNEQIRIGGIASAKSLENVAFDGTVTCGIPGHDHPGQESVSSLTHNDGPFQWDYKERCGFATDFAYAS